MYLSYSTTLYREVCDPCTYHTALRYREVMKVDTEITFSNVSSLVDASKKVSSLCGRITAGRWRWGNCGWENSGGWGWGWASTNRGRGGHLSTLGVMHSYCIWKAHDYKLFTTNYTQAHDHNGGPVPREASDNERSSIRDHHCPRYYTE